MDLTMDNEYHQITPKMSGYLEKKGRKKMMSCYKKYWFVLEGRLLLYYKSKDEYDAISPCKGSINLGPTCNVKPCSSNSGVFQIESKTTTITLRAENKEDQHKWMQSLISALNQKNDFKKLNHFRYSVGELSPTSEKIPLERQNTLPDRFITTETNDNTKIIEKLQRMGAKSYGIGPNIQKSASSLQRQISFSDESIPSSTNFKTHSRFRNAESVIIENEEYGKLDQMRRLTNSVESVDDSSEGIYERIPSSDSVFLRRDDVKMITSQVNFERSKSVEEDIYSEPKEMISQENKNNRSTLITDNDVYWNRTNIEKLNIGTDYCCEAFDYNDNNIKDQIRKSSPRSDSDEIIYAEADVKDNRSTGNSAEYADIGQVEYTDVDQYVEIDGLRNSSMSSQGSSEDKDKKIFGFGKKNKGSKEKSEEKKKKVQKSESFLQRVWHKKSKNKKNKKDLSLSTNNLAEKINMTDDVAMKTLSELQDILQKQNATVKQLHETIRTRHSVAEEEVNEKTEEICKEMRMDNGSPDTTPEENEGKNCPTLPPRNPKKSSSSSYKETVKPQPPLVPPKIKKRVESASLEEILDDLNKQTNIAQKVALENSGEEEDSQNKEGKVKELIKRFSIGKEEGVEIRQRSPNWKLKSETSTGDSNELDKLLDELAKVTTAPIMTPGVTTSLINPEVSDKEIMNMVPTRRRRMSDPDYDVPRPHRSLINLPKKDENALEATRFFGPILKPSDYGSHTLQRPPTPPADYHSNLPSITPDSLEVECRKNDLSHEELRKVSFESHEYLSYNRTSHHNLNFLVDRNIYSDPRSLNKISRNDLNIYPQRMSVHHFEEPENRFDDSLEP